MTTMPLILQTELERHVENRLYPVGVAEDGARGLRRSLCSQTFTARTAKLVRVPRIPPAAVCPACVATARRWYAASYFEPFDVVQRWRLLTALGRDLAGVA